MPTEIKVGPVQAIVAQVKEIARTALRGQLISARLSRIAGLNIEVADLKKSVDSENKEIARANYAKSIIDPKNPDAADLTKEADARVESATKSIESLNKSIDGLNKSIVEQNDGIAKIESGETKVNAEELACLVDKMLVARAKEAGSNLS